MVSMGLSSGACRTIMREPIRHSAQPTRPRCPSRSLSRKDASTALRDSISSGTSLPERITHPMRTLSAPSGVTSTGGANVYAAKLATVITVVSRA
jgi:hypothetical protein